MNLDRRSVDPWRRPRLIPILASFVLGASACQRAEDTRSLRVPQSTAVHGADGSGERATLDVRREAASTGLVVVAPHPDDEALMASGVLLRARERGEAIRVIVLTNGDFDCRADGRARQAESVAGLAALGIREDQVVFLGYPDGFLSRLGHAPLPAVRRREGERCVLGDTTYGARGRDGRDYHSARFGEPALYTADALTRDLASVLAEFDPERLIVTHPEDSHPDHAAAYVFVRRALAALTEAPELWRAIVHNGDCWPTGERGAGACEPGGLVVGSETPGLTGSLSGYGADRRVEVPASCLLPDFHKNPKLLAIAAHASQTRSDTASYLFSFARRDEMFFTEMFARQHDGAWLVEPVPNWAETREVTSDAPEARHFVAESWPARLRFSEDFMSAGENRTTRVRVSEARSSIDYELGFDEREGAFELVRRDASRPGERGVVLGHFLLPFDLSFARAPGHFEIRVEPRPKNGGVLELSLVLDGDLLGVAVDPAGRSIDAPL